MVVWLYFKSTCTAEKAERKSLITDKLKMKVNLKRVVYFLKFKIIFTIVSSFGQKRNNSRSCRLRLLYRKVANCSAQNVSAN